jgi:hypothetical protein
MTSFALHTSPAHVIEQDRLVDPYASDALFARGRTSAPKATRIA